MANGKSNAEKTDQELIDEYWRAHAEFGPFEIGPEEYLRQVRAEHGREEILQPSEDTESNDSPTT